MNKKSILQHFFIGLIFVCLTVGAAMAQGAGFNFQGRLNDGTSPANGQYDLQFQLYDAITGGAQIGATLPRPSTTLINGVFSTTLDFGATAFNNPNVFIEIAVRPNGSPNAYTILGPRQQLTVVPFAVRAASSANSDNATNAVNAQNAVNATNATNATNANNSTTAATATNALSLGGVSPDGYAKLSFSSMFTIPNSGYLFVEGNVRQSTTSNGLVKAMLSYEINHMPPYSPITRCYNGVTGVTNSSTGTCGFVITQPLAGVVRIDFGFPISDRFVSVSARYDESGTHSTGANYRQFDSTSIEVFTYDALFPDDTYSRSFTLILY